MSSRSKKISWRLGISAVLIVVGYVLAMLLLPAPQPTVSLAVKSGSVDTGQPGAVPWPEVGGAAIGVVGQGVLASKNADTPKPTASIAKIILAMAVLQQKPLKINESGPTITFTDDDVATYNADIAMNGAVVPVMAGEQLSEYQALQALLLSSANNIASSLARWAFGSESNYINYATDMLHNLGLTKTQVADASGYSPRTVSTPRELVLIGEEAIKNQPLAQIVSQKQATLPTLGVIANHNTDLGQRNIDGLKTGTTNEAGGCLLFSATRKVDEMDVKFVGAVQALPDIQQALDAAPDLVDSGYLNLHAASLPRHIGTITAPWANAVNIVPKDTLDQVTWNGTPLKRDIAVSAGLSGVVGHAKLGTLTSDLMLESTIPEPSPWWRLTHPLQMLKGVFGRS